MKIMQKPWWDCTDEQDDLSLYISYMLIYIFFFLEMAQMQ